MKYLIIMPDYTGSCIRDEFNGEIALNDLDLPMDIVDELIAWHSAYRKVIPLSEEERERQIDQIKELDSIGLKLAKKIKELIPGGAKVKYFSEGRLKYLHVD